MNDNTRFPEGHEGSGITIQSERKEDVTMTASTQFHEGYENGGTPIEQESSSTPVQQESSSTPVQQESSSTPVKQESSSAPVQPENSPAPVQPENGPAPAQPGNGPAPVQQERQEKPRKGKTGGIIALALCCSLLGGAVGAGGFALASGSFKGSSSGAGTVENTATVLQGQREAAVLNTAYVNTDSEMTASQIYAANVNSTVGITTSVTTNYFGFQTTTPASGSGFILTDNGYIVTNYHVVEDADEIKVTAYDNTVYEAKLVGRDESNDIAVLKVEAEGLTPVVLGNSDQLNVGDSVVAIGNPLGELTFSLTSGSVSALNRKVTISNTAMTLIQTDCAINSGNSGGALFNTHGEVIGITNAKYSSSGSSSSASIDNIGFAIPINSVKDIIESIIENGYVVKPYIGVSIYELGSQYQMFGLSGVAIQSVEEDSPAASAGLQANDIVTKVNGTEINSVDEFKSFVSGGNEGDVLKLTVYRQTETVEIEVKLTMRQQSALPETDTSSQQSQQWQSGQGQFPFMGGGFPN